MSTSGQYVTEFIIRGTCTRENNDGQECDYYGFVEAFYDPELSISEVTWDCPTCGIAHTEDVP